MRRAASLIELLIVVGIVALLLGVLLPAVQKIRVAALTTKSTNNLKQIALAASAYAADRDQRLPYTYPISLFGQQYNETVFVSFLPYLEQAPLHRKLTDLSDHGSVPAVTVPTFLSPLDPSLAVVARTGLIFGNGHAFISYAYNAQVFTSQRAVPPNLAGQFSDGLSRTMLFSEHFAFNCGGFSFSYLEQSPASPPVLPSEDWPDKTWRRRPSIADGGPGIGAVGVGPAGDYYPITGGQPPTSRASDPVTFQHRPRLRDCDPRLPNSTSLGGLQVAFADGSVRLISPAVAPEVFWAAVTPDRGEVFDIGN